MQLLFHTSLVLIDTYDAGMTEILAKQYYQTDRQMVFQLYIHSRFAKARIKLTIAINYSYVRSVYHQNTAAPRPCFLNVCSSDQPLAM